MDVMLIVEDPTFIIRMCYGYSRVSYFYKPGYMKSGDPEGCKTEIKVKEQCLYICSTFHRNRRVFNNEHNVHMRVLWCFVLFFVRLVHHMLPVS
jgi:hypothetical protein